MEICLRKLALFRIGCGEYEQFPEEKWSRLDMEVHEHPVLNGTTGEIRTRLRHHDRGPMASLSSVIRNIHRGKRIALHLASKLREPRRGRPSTNANDLNIVTLTGLARLFLFPFSLSY